jgi:hypothetical protein
MSGCYFSICINHGYFINMSLSGMFYNDIDMMEAMIEYCKGPSGEFFWSIDFSRYIINNVEDLLLVLNDNKDNVDITILINVKYITTE